MRSPLASVALYEPFGSRVMLQEVPGRPPVESPLEFSASPAAAPGTTTANAATVIRLKRARRSLKDPPPAWGNASKLTAADSPAASRSLGAASLARSPGETPDDDRRRDCRGSPGGRGG